ncbi:MAG: hypothetical protein ACK4IS_13115 [Erythrobacter sp.]
MADEMGFALHMPSYSKYYQGLAIDTTSLTVKSCKNPGFPSIFEFGTRVAERQMKNPRVTKFQPGRPSMLNRNNTAQGFWQSKLGHAALASIAAMVLMIALTSQVVPGAASAAGPGHTLISTSAFLEIA